MHDGHAKLAERIWKSSQLCCCCRCRCRCHSWRFAAGGFAHPPTTAGTVGTQQTRVECLEWQGHHAAQGRVPWQPEAFQMRMGDGVTVWTKAGLEEKHRRGHLLSGCSLLFRPTATTASWLPQFLWILPTAGQPTELEPMR
mmetsp:Transcript_67841/g.141802  ORF Transcript_67841/g.141802 Transcript_67841/m.141802 type:complete len:141 (-) Transcript_67841:1496-1918(-)